MSKQANPTVIGGFVLGALILVVVSVLVFTSGAWMRERVQLVTYFTSTVQGLTVGSQVLFQGVPVGQVTDIGVDYVAARESFRIPVGYEVWPSQIHVLGEPTGAGVRKTLQRLVDEHGLRAKLESVSFVTGQYVITLGLVPDARRREYPPDPKGRLQVPSTPATRDQVEQIFESVDVEGIAESVAANLSKLQTLLSSDELASALGGLDRTLREASTLLAKVNAGLDPMLDNANDTLMAYEELAETLEGRIDPMATRIERSLDTLVADVSSLTGRLDARVEPVTVAATDALDEFGGAMRAVSEFVGDGSSARLELSLLLTEATRTAQSLRSLADYLERHPEALLQGKR